MGEKRRSPSPVAAAAVADANSTSNAQRTRHDSDELQHPAKRLHRDVSSSTDSAAAASDTLPSTVTASATKATAAFSQDSTLDVTEDTSSDTSMLASTQDISMTQCSDEQEALAPAADDLVAIPQTPPPVSSHARGLQSPSSRLSGSAGPRMQLDPTGSAKMFHAASASSSSSSAVVSSPLPPSCPTVTFHTRFPVLSEHDRIFTPVQRDALGKLWRVIWYPHGQHVYDDVVSVFVEMGVDETAPTAASDALADDTSSSSSDSPSLDAAAAAATAAVATRSVRVEFVLLSQSGDAALHQRQISRVHEFSALSHEFGMSKFCSRKELLNPLNGFLTPDGCVDIEVHLHTVDDDDAQSDATPDVPTSPPLAAIDALGANAMPSTHDMDAPYVAYDSKTETGMVGLKNQGATCYMNSLLQTLFHLRAFRQVVYETPSEREDTHDSVSLALQRVFYRLQTKRSAVSTKELTRSFGWSQIDSFMQHDVQELYRILCDRLEEKMKRTNVDGAIKRLFEGQVRSFVQCVHVDFQSFRDESFYDLQLDVKGCKDIYASFRKYVETELLDGDNQYDAEGHGKQDAKKGVRFLRLPPVLNIQLKRFEYDPMRDGMVKIHDRFEFPKTLVLDDFLSSSESGGQDAATTTPSTTPQHVYHLHSVLVHSGDVHGGHYYVFIRPGKDIASSSSWYRFDDDQISIVDEQTAIEGNYGSVASTANVVDSRPSTPLYGALSSSPDRDAFQSADVIPDDDRTDDVYDYSRSNGVDGSSGPSTSSLMLPLGRSFSSAYMLVYVRDGNNDIQSIAEAPAAAMATDASHDANADDDSAAAAAASEPLTSKSPAPNVSSDLTVPEPLVRRFLEEERAHARRKKMQQTEHLYMTVRIASDSSVASLQRITKTLDFSSFGNSACLRIRIKRTAPIAQLYARIFQKTGVPVRRQRLWKVITRENRTQRPDALVDEDVVDCIERLIDDDASPKAPVKLFLQILNDDELESEEDADEASGEDATDLARLSRKPKARTSVVRRHFWSEFTPPAAPSASNGDDDDAKQDGDAMDMDGDDDNCAADADSNALLPRVRVLQSLYDILLFIKWYDRTKALSERLEYMGNIVIDSRRTGAELAKYLHEALRIPFTRELVLFEEVQPQQVAEIEMDMRLEAAEIQHGDIICYQFADDDNDNSADGPATAVNAEGATSDSAAALVPRPRAPEKYPNVPQYFRYLLDRVEVVFRRHRRDGTAGDATPTDGDETDDTFSLGLLYSNVYDDIVDAVAAHLGFDDTKRLHVRLYQHSPLSNQPKKNPLRHAKYAGNTHVTLDELLTEFTERTNVLYYEVLAHPITEIEAKRQVVVYFSIYEPTPLGVDAAAPQTPRRVEFLVLPSATVSDLLTQIRDAFDVPRTTALRVCEVSADGTRILEILDASASLDALSTSSGYSSSGEHALLVETIPADELVALSARNATDDASRANDNDDDEDDEDDPVLRIGVVHFSFQTNTHVYIQTHGVPFVVHFRLSETVAQVKERIRQRCVVVCVLCVWWLRLTDSASLSACV